MHRVWAQLRRIACLAAAAALASALLAHYAPGAAVDEREMNQRMSEDAIAALRAQKAAENSIGSDFAEYLRRLARGDLGYSASHHAPIASLIADRAPETLREIAAGLATAWLLAFALAIPAGAWKAGGYDAASIGLSGLLLSVPITLIAYLLFSIGTKTDAVLAVVLTPRVFRYFRNLIRQAYGANYIDVARARGIAEWRILCAHVLPAIGPQLAAVAAVSTSMAIDAAIPAEAICNVPGLGRLAWQAATARDLPLLVNLTVLIAAATTGAMAISEFALPAETAR
jgi:peptide/nickel transport system permease protein